MMLERILKQDPDPCRIMTVRDKHMNLYLPMRTYDEGLSHIQWLFGMWNEEGYYWSIEDAPVIRAGFGVIIKDDFADEKKAYQQAINGNPLWLMDLTQDWEYQEWDIQYLHRLD